MQAEKTEDGIDFVDVWQQFDCLENGYKAMLKRVKTPAELRETPAYYRLFPGERPHLGWLRVAFMLPWCEHAGDAKNIAEQLATGKKKVSEMRVYQMARMQEPLDVEQFRRMAIQIKPTVNWKYFGPMVFYWGDKNKQRFVEDFFIAKTKADKPGKGE